MGVDVCRRRVILANDTQMTKAIPLECAHSIGSEGQPASFAVG